VAGAAPTEVRSFGHKILVLYQSGKVPEARRALVDLARKQIEAWDRIEGDQRRDVEARLGISQVAWLITKCLGLDAKYSVRREVPSEIVRVSEQVLSALDTALVQARKAPQSHPRFQSALNSARRSKERLVIDLVRALHRAGEKARARAMAERYQEVLRRKGVSIEQLLGQGEPEDAGPPKAQEVVSGRALAICQLLLRYYHALAAEDVEALDDCLLLTPQTARGKDLVTPLVRRRERDADFSGLGPVRFDDRTEMTITPVSDGEYDVLCADLVKSRRQDQEVRWYRHTDRFLVRVADGEYKIVIKRVKPMKGEPE
jgi:hypothetical protein